MCHRGVREAIASFATKGARLGAPKRHAFHRAIEGERGGGGRGKHVPPMESKRVGPRCFGVGHGHVPAKCENGDGGGGGGDGGGGGGGEGGGGEGGRGPL